MVPFNYRRKFFKFQNTHISDVKYLYIGVILDGKIRYNLHLEHLKNKTMKAFWIRREMFAKTNFHNKDGRYLELPRVQFVFCSEVNLDTHTHTGIFNYIEETIKLDKISSVYNSIARYNVEICSSKAAKICFHKPESGIFCWFVDALKTSNVTYW